MNTPAFTIWFTGITGSGKSTLAKLLHDSLATYGRKVELLDSGRIRRELNPDLGFTPEDVRMNLKRLAYECEMLNRNGVVTIVAAVSPYRAHREEIRAQIGRFVEIFCDATLEELQQRDKTDLFARARRGEIQNVAGVNAPYEAPEKPEVHLQTGQRKPRESLDRILKTLEDLNYTPKRQSSGYTPEEERMIKARFKDLDYT